jgi:maltose alpha-D-glucosyltransferase/alpha-amylase
MRLHKGLTADVIQDDALWYKDAIIYEVHVRAFQDSTRDGIGDFRGLLNKLDYLHDLGVTVIWLLPFYPSPLRDDGYDIADYTDINSIYGNLNDFKAVLREAHRRGMRVVTELVINHTSDRHPWFQRARLAPAGSDHRNYYVWNDSPEKYQDARVIFSDFESSNWTWDGVARAFYWHRFYSHQPDLNFENPAVHQEIIDVLDFWLNLGIDGLRLDAVPYLYEREGTSCENLPETHAFLKKLRAHVDEHFKNRMLLAEANQWPEDAVAYFGSGDECHMAFHFPLMPRLFMSIRMEDRFPILDILQQTPAIPENCQWALFLRNHDELTLEMVTAEDRDYMYRVYAQDVHARVNLGIRRRLAPLLENHRGKIELMNGLLFSLPGTPVLYYGDEIGMGDNIFLGDRNGVRTPMQWSPERNSGFSETNPQRLYLPVIIDPEYHYQTVNVEAQQNNPHSLLWWMKRLIALRKRHQAFGRGALEFLHPDNHKVIAYLRRDANEQILVVANLSRYVQCAEIDLSAYKGATPIEMFGRTALPVIGDRTYQVTLGPYAFYWLLLQPAVVLQHSPEADRPLAITGEWQAIFASDYRDRLEKAIAGYLKNQSWFAGRGGVATAVRIADTLSIGYDGGIAHLVILHVDNSMGEVSIFTLPIAFQASTGEADTNGFTPICRLVIKGRAGEPETAGILYDPLMDKAFTKTLLDSFARHRRLRSKTAELAARTTSAFHRLRDLNPQRLDPVPTKAMRTNTSINFGDQVILKFYRGVEEGAHPGIEVGNALAAHSDFRQFAPLVGTLEYRVETAPGPMTIAALFQFVPHESDAWNFTEEALKRYFEHLLTRREQRPTPLLPNRTLLEQIGEPFPGMAVEWIGSYLESARLMGKRTAEMHVALAHITKDPEFRPEPFTFQYQRSIYQTERNWIFRTWQLLRARVQELLADARAAAQLVLGREADFIQHLRAIMSRRIVAQRTRCHGDVCLDNLLYTGKDFVFIDFEGEVLHPLSTRRHKHSPLRDVASWLHSMRYAVQHVLHDDEFRPEDLAILGPWGRFWHRWVGIAFLKAYVEVARTASYLPATIEEMQLILDCHQLGRVVYELRYHLLNHPTRVVFPLQSLLNLLQERDRLQAAPTEQSRVPAPSPHI